MRTLTRVLPALLGMIATDALSADVSDRKDKRLTAELYFQWEEASDPQISPDGSRIVYVRRWPDVMTDRRFSNLWTVNFTAAITGHSPPVNTPTHRRAGLQTESGSHSYQIVTGILRFTFAGWIRDRLRE